MYCDTVYKSPDLIQQVRQDHAKSVFASCTVAVKHVVHIALYLLPYAVTQVLQDGTPHDVKEVCFIVNTIIEVMIGLKDHRIGFEGKVF